ncbi:unnamed protein product, partial [Ectocarpus sp. 12 AP-2014]
LSQLNTTSKNHKAKSRDITDEFGLITIISAIFTFLVFIYTLIFHSYIEQILALIVAVVFGIGFILNRLDYRQATRLYMTLLPPLVFMSLILLIGGYFGQGVAFATMGFLAFIGYRKNPRLRNIIIFFDVLAFILPTIYVTMYGPILGTIDVP